MTILSNSRFVIYVCVGVLSCLLSAYKILALDVINGDGILYINVARTFLESGFATAANVYAWPFYGVLIGLLHKVAGIRFDNAAYLINAVFLMLSCVMFVRLYEVITNGKGRLWVAAVLILSLPLLNDYRDLVIRGYGFWLFMLIALYWFILYSRKPTSGIAIMWQLSVAAATLFRIEGVAFIALAPLYFLFARNNIADIVRHLLRLNSVFLSLAAIAAVVMLVFSNTHILADANVPFALIYLSPAALFSALLEQASALYERMPLLSSHSEAGLILVVGLAALVLFKVSCNMGLPFLLVLLYGRFRGWIVLSKESYIVLYFAGIGLLILLAVVGNQFFISSRFTMLTVLLLSLISFQYIDDLLLRFTRQGLTRRSLFAWLIILVMFLDGIISGGASKENIREAGKWLRQEMPADSRIACNEARLEFYSDQLCKWEKIDNENVTAWVERLGDSGYDHLLLWISRRDTPLSDALASDSSLQSVRDFPNSKGDRVILYRVARGR